MSITKVDDAVPSDQKIYSQSIPCDPSRMDIFILPDGEVPTSGPQVGVQDYSWSATILGYS